MVDRLKNTASKADTFDDIFRLLVFFKRDFSGISPA